MPACSDHLRTLLNNSQLFPKHSIIIKIFVPLILLFGLVYQSWHLFPQVGEDLVKVRKDIGQSGLWRSANFSQNQRFANYVKFLHENIPQHARVILPSKEEGSRAITTTPFMQFFLAPREILNCIQPLSDCIAEYSSNHTYYLIPDAPSLQNSRASLSPRRLILFDQSWGLLIPQNPTNDLISPLPTFSNLKQILLAALWPGLWLAALVASGFFFIPVVFQTTNFSDRIVFAIGFSLGLLSISLLFLMLAGVHLSPAILLSISIIWLAIAVFFWHSAAKQRPTNVRIYNLSDFSTHIWFVLFGILSLLTAILAVGKGYHASDAISLWGAKGYGIASQGLVTGISFWGTSTTRYPLHIPILIASFKVLFSEVLPASKLVFPLYYLGLLGVMYRYLETRIPQVIAGIGCLTFATAPILFRHAQLAYANLTFTFYVVSAVLIFLDALDHSNAGIKDKRLFLAGLFFMFSAWTRPEGILLSGLTLMMVIISSSPIKNIGWKSLVRIATPLTIFAFLWLLLSRYIYITPTRESELFSSALIQFLRGNLHLSEAGFILEYLGSELINPSSWGIIGIGIILFLSVDLLLSRRLFFTPTLLAGFVFIAAISGVYYLTSYDNNHDISWWVSTGMNRMIFPGIALLWIGSVEKLFKLINQP